MKKSLAIIMSLSLVATAAFAQDAAVAATATTAAKTVAAPVATYGFKADFEARVAKDNASDTFEQGKRAEPVSKFNPFGLKATKFAVNPFVNLDWSKMSVKAEAAYNAFDANLDDYSKIALTTTWKDFYGVEIKSEVAADNKGVKDATVDQTADSAARSVALGDLSNDITATYTNKDAGVTLYTKYDAAKVFGLLNFGGQADSVAADGTTDIAGAATTGENLKAMFDGFAEMGLALDTADFAAKAVYKPANNYFTGDYAQSEYDSAYNIAYATSLGANPILSANAAQKATAAAAGKTAGDLAVIAANANAAGKKTYETNAANYITSNRFSTAWFEARKMFNVWTARFNDDAEMALRIKDLDSKVTIDRSGYGIGKGNNILGGLKKDGDMNDAIVKADGTKATTVSNLVWLTDMNMLNTFTPVKGLTVKAAVVLPTSSDVTMMDWRKGENLSIGAEYAIDGVGTIAAGTLVSMDYTACDIGGNFQGPSKRLTTIAGNLAVAGTFADSTAFLSATYGSMGAAIATVEGMNATALNASITSGLTKLTVGGVLSAVATNDKTIDWDSAYWLDANLSQLVGKDNGLFVSLDGQFGNYIKTQDTLDTWAKLDATKKPYELEMGSVSKWAIGAEGAFKASDALKLSVAAMFKMGAGYNTKAVTGEKWADVAATKAILDNDLKANYVASNYNETNVLAYNTYEIKPLELNVRADYTVSKNTAIYLTNGFNLNAGDLQAGILDDDTPITTLTATAKTMYGFYSKNTVGLGATLAATEKSKLTISGDYNMYLGVPTAKQLYADGADSDSKADLDAAYGLWKSTNFNPFAVKVAYSYAY